MDIPNAGSHISVTKKGHLQKLSSRSFPYIPHPWKRKFCVLVKGQLFYYEKEDSKGADKGCGVINLEYYDQVVEAPSKECKKATNVFVLTSHDRSFFDPGRHLFSAESPKELQEWMRHLKRAIEQIRNNNRTAGAGAGSFLKPSTPRQSGGATKGETAKAEGGGALKAQGGGARKTEGWTGAGKDKTKRKDGVEEDGQGKRRNEEEVENKENLEDWTDSKGRKQKYSDTSLRRRKGNPSSRSMDESSLLGSLLAADNSSKGGGTNAVGSSLLAADNLSKGGGTNAVGRKKGAGGTSDPEPNSGPNSLGRQLKLGGKLGPDFSRIGSGGGQVDVEGMMFGSLSRQSKVEGSSAKGSASGVSGDSGCSGSGGSGNVERRKRKADDDGLEEEDDGASAMKTSESGPQLESVTKHRVKGPAGRRMPQNRRTQHQMMKQRASSLSALAHNADNVQSTDNPTASFVPWLNRSLDLLGEEQLLPASRNSQPALGFLYSDQEDLEEDQLYEYNIGFNTDNLSFEENGGLYIQEGGSFVLQQHPNAYGSLNISGSGLMPPPPLPPRMESKMEFASGQHTPMQMAHPYQLQQHQQLQQQLQQMQIQASLQQQQQNQMCSPFGTQQSDLMSDRDRTSHRRSKHLDDMSGDVMMTRSMTNELFIASYSDDNSCDASNPQLHRSQEQQRRQRVGSPSDFGDSGSPGSKGNGKPRPKSAAGAGGKPNSQKSSNRKPMSQPDINRFTVAVRNLQKHVVELDQAVNEITKEVEDSKVDLGSIRSNLMTVKKDKDRLHDAISIVNQEASKIKDQVASALKETEKLQKSATAALVVAEKARVDQQTLKKEYEGMLRDLKTAIEEIKKDALKNFATNPSPAIRKRGGEDKGREEEESEDEEEGDSETEEGKETVKRKVTVLRTKSKESARGSSSKLNEGSKSEGKSSGYQSFFSRPSSILSGLANRSSMMKSTTSIDSPDKHESPNKSKEKSKEKAFSKSDSKSEDKKTKKEKTTLGVKSSKEPGSLEREKLKKLSRNLSADFPMMDETGSPSTLSPNGSIPDITNEESIQINNYNLGKSTSSPTMPSRPKALNLKGQKSEIKASSAASSPDSPTRPSSPFDLPKFHLNGRATSPTGFALHRPGSTPGPMVRQGSMSTVPEDRAVDTRTFDNRPTDPPPPPPTNRVFAISRQSSTPNIATQKTTSPLVLQRQHSLGIVQEEHKSPISRQSSVMSMPDDRLIVDQTLPMSPTSSMMSFPGSWSTTSLNRQDSNLGLANGLGSTDFVNELSSTRSPTSPRGRPRGALEQVAGGVLAGSSLQPGIICPLDESGEDPPLATSSLKKRKKVKKDPVVV